MFETINSICSISMNSELFFLMDPGFCDPKFQLQLPIGISAQPCVCNPELKFNLEALFRIKI